MTTSDNTVPPNEAPSGDQDAKAARKRFLIIIACFGIPLLLAIIWLQVVRMQGGTWGDKSWGELIHPAQPLTEFSLNQFVMKNNGQTADTAFREPADNFNFESFRGIWSMVYMPEGACEETCQKNFYHMRQVRLALNNRMNRVQRVAVVESPNQLGDELLAQHLGLRVLSGSDTDVAAVRDQIKSAESERDMSELGDAIYIVDPFGNVMMRFPPDLDPGKMLKDLKHLLKVSRIG